MEGLLVEEIKNGSTFLPYSVVIATSGMAELHPLNCTIKNRSKIGKLVCKYYKCTCTYSTDTLSLAC